MTNTCWDVLQIQPTIDVEAIKSARRTLMKSWHPDVAGVAEEKAAYNARCAQINAAYDDAVRFAKAWRPPTRRDADPSEKKNPSTHSYIQRRPFASGQAILLSFIFFFVFASRAGFRLFVLMSFFAAALAFVTALDWFLFRFAIQPVLSSAPDPFHTTGAWLMLAVTNIAVLSFGLAEISFLLFGFIGGGIFDVTVGVALPLWMSLNARPRPNVCS